MTNYEIRQRVQTTVDAPAAWEGAWSAPAGTQGTVTGIYGDQYGVLLDGDPDQLPASYTVNELAPALSSEGPR
ncbi:hypothetical protein ACIPJG_25345 [Streptomyces halstedii]|uniref:hypothetical protein n=1 Tax=Streptomyces halstedii TaxID=1944 RepID=UPI00381086FC